MRNLKRVLSLVLAAMMLIGMMVVGASAVNAKDFTDYDEIQHKEAVNTMVALNVINGKEDGSSFDPAGTLTREEMSKIITFVMNGGTEPALGVKPVPTYSDIDNTWAEKYIEYCTSAGIIAGDGTGKFNPKDTLTGEQAAKMLLVAMGYNAKVFGFTGNDWAVNTNRYANEAGLYKDLSGMEPSAPISRDDACQLAYNAIQATMMQKTWTINPATGEMTEGYSLWIDNSGTSGAMNYSTAHTLLTEKFDGITYEGVLTQSGRFAIEGSDAASKKLDIHNVSKINGITVNSAEAGNNAFFATGVTYEDTTDLVGQYVKVLMNRKTNEVYGVYADDSQNEIVVDTTASLVDMVQNNTKVTVGDNTYSIASDARYYVNGGVGADAWDGVDIDDGLQALLDVDKDALKATGDSIRLISNDGDDSIDAIFINTVAVAEVSYVGTESFSVINSIGTRGVGNGAADYDATNQKLEDVTVEGDLTSGAMVVITEDYYTNTDVYTVVDKQSGTIEGVRTDSRNNNVEFQIDGQWYMFYNYTRGNVSATTLKSGDEIEFVAIGNVLYHAKRVEAADRMNIAFVITAADTAGAETDITSGVPQAKLLFADGSSAVVDTVDNNGDPDKTVDDTMVGKMVTYTKTTSGSYILKLVEDEDAGTNFGGFDGAQLDNVINTASTGKISGMNGIELADDAVVFIMKAANANTANAANTAKVYTGKEVKSLAKGTYATAGVVYTEVNGFKYGKVAVLTSNADLPDTFTGMTYGYLVENAYETYDADTTTTWRNYSIWNGEEVVTLKENSNAGLSNLVKGATIVYDVVGDGEIKNVSVAPGLQTTQVSGYDNERIQLVGVDGAKKITSDTVVLYVDSAKGVGVEGGQIVKANDTNANGSIDAADAANVRYIISSTNSDELALLVVDVNNDMKAAPDQKMALSAGVSNINAALTNGNVILSNTTVVLPDGLKVPAGRVLDVSAASGGVTATGTIDLLGTLKADNRNIDLTGATAVNYGKNTKVETTGTVTLDGDVDDINGTWNVGTLTSSAAGMTDTADTVVNVTNTATVNATTVIKGNWTVGTLTGAGTSLTLDSGSELHVTTLASLTGVNVTLTAGTEGNLTVLDVPNTSIITSALALVDYVDVTVKDLSSSGNFSGASAGANTNVTVTGNQAAVSVFAGNYTFKGNVTGAITLDDEAKITFEKAVTVNTALAAAQCGNGVVGAEITFKTAQAATALTANASSGDGFFTNDGTAVLTDVNQIMTDVVYKLTSNAAGGSNNGWVKQ